MTSAADRLRTVLRGVGQLLITLGVVVLLFCVYELYFTNLYTDRQQSRLRDTITRTWALPASPSGAAPAPLPLGSGIALLWIPRIGMVGPGPRGARVVVEGVGHEDLKKGPGHYPGTALPGQVGNVVISGHRTTYGAPFNRVDELRRGDAIVLETGQAWITYRVTALQVVAPTAVEVTYPVPGQPRAIPTERRLTLTTCNPKYSATQRLVVSALLQVSQPRSASLPPALAGA